MWNRGISKDDSTGHSEWKKKKRYRRRCEKDMTGMDFASSTRPAEDGTKWKGVVAKLPVVPERPCKVMG